MPVVEHKAAKTGPDTVTLEADRVEGIYKQEMEAIGDAKLCHAGMTLTADRMKYFPQTKDAEVTGNIRLDRKNDFIQGDYLKLNLDTQVGFLTEPRYTMKEGDGRGTGEQLFFEGKNQYRLKKGEYTTCPVDDEDWYIRASDLKIDSEKEVGEERYLIGERVRDVRVGPDGAIYVTTEEHSGEPIGTVLRLTPQQ